MDAVLCLTDSIHIINIKKILVKKFMNRQAKILLFLTLLTLFSWVAYVICVYYDVNYTYISILRITSQVAVLLFGLVLAYFRYKNRSK